MKVALAAVVACLVLAAGATGGSGVGGSVRVSPLVLALDIKKATVEAGKNVSLQVNLANAGSGTVRDTLVTLRSDPAVTFREATQSVAVLAPGVARNVAWEACSTVAGRYVLLARASAPGAGAAESAAAVLTVTAGGKNTRC